MPEHAEPSSLDFRRIFESLPGRYLVLTPDFTIVAVSDAYVEATRTRREDILGKNLFTVFPENPDAPTGGESKLRSSLETVLRDRSAHTMLVTKYDIPRPAAEGGGFEERYWSPVNAPVFDDAGDLIYIVHRVEDITEFVQLKEEGHRMEEEIFIRAREVDDVNCRLRSANEALAERERERTRLLERLRELDELKTAFFANVSHELRTPLTLILGPIQEAEEDQAPLPAEHRRLVYRSARRLLKLVNTLLDFTCIEAGRMQLSFLPTDMALFTADLASAFRSMIERAGLALTVRCPPLPQPVYLARDAYEKIVLNLLSNAFKFTPAGEIRVSLASAGDHVELEVQDTGVGIPAQALPHIFERFHRVKETRGRTHEGSGIGLALVRELVEMHGGTIAVASEPDRGTTFTLRFRYGSDHLPVEQLGEEIAPAGPTADADAFVEEAEQWLASDIELPARHAPMVPGPPAAGAARQRILVVEDNADMCRYLVHLLDLLGIVEAALDGASALDMARRHPPDLVITDIMMPALDGFELLAALRSDPATAQVPILMLSARAGEEAKVEGLVAGADDYLIKPFSARELLARAHAQLRTGELRRMERARAQEAHEDSLRKDEFLAILGHELRNPLAPISNAAALLQQDPGLQGPSARAVDIILRQSKQMARLIDDLLDVSRITRGRIVLARAQVDVVRAMDEAIETMHALVAQRRHRVSLHAPERPLMLHADPARLAQIFANLLDNAAKYTPEPGCIEVDIRRDGEMARISITDTGVGIPAELLPGMFEMFRQGDQAAGLSRGGLGLGLAVVRRLVEMHGGRVQAHSAGPGRGSTFVVELPLTASSPAGADGTDIQSALDKDPPASLL